MYSEDSLEPKLAEKQRSNRQFIIFSLIFNIILVAATGVLYHRNSMLQDEIHEYAQELETVSENMMTYEQQLDMALTQLSYYKDIATQLSIASSDGESSPGIIGSATVPVVTVKTLQNGFSTSYEGEILQAKVELVKGEGRVLVDTEVINGVDIQTSLRTAADITAELTGVSFSGTDIILTIEGGSDVEIVDGPSAGAALTIAIYSAITGQEPLSSVYITGTISSDGSVGIIGGVEYKAVAVAEDGGNIFLVPNGQSIFTTYQAVTRDLGRRSFTFYETVRVDLSDYLAEQGYDLEVVEVNSIEEAIPYFFAA